MKIFHIESGLGNQMLDYADMIASRLVNPSETYYIDTIVYDSNQDAIKMWNGYELEHIFGIKEHNIKELFSEAQWKNIISDVNKSQFWKYNWSYSVAITNALRKQGLNLIDINPREVKKTEINPYSTQNMISKHKYLLKRTAFTLFPDRYQYQFGIEKQLFRTSLENEFDGHYLKFKYKGNGIERIDKKLRETFVFPKYDEKNLNYSRKLHGCNSVAIHARRGDLLGTNAYCYEYGFFKRAVQFIKKNVANPVFVFFCDPGSVAWCKQNLKVFGLVDSDNIEFADWNGGNNSFRDMQLMAECKHNIITESTFGWWGAYLNKNPDKITCSPDIRMNTTHWF